MPAVKPQVELPPYKVVDPTVRSRLSIERDYDFMNRSGGLVSDKNSDEIFRYHVRWQPYYLKAATWLHS